MTGGSLTPTDWTGRAVSQSVRESLVGSSSVTSQPLTATTLSGPSWPTRQAREGGGLDINYSS